MSSDEQDRSRKTLTIKKTARPARADDSQKRTRTGARARLVAQNERTKEQVLRSDPNYVPVEKPARGMDTPRGRPMGGPRGAPDNRAPRAPGARSGAPSADRGPKRAPQADSRPASPPRAPRTDRTKRNVPSEKYFADGAPRPDRFYDPFDDNGPAPTPAQAAGMADPVVTQTRAPYAPKQAETFPIFAPCPQGLEEALTAEMQALGFDDAKVGRAGCHFTADWSGVQRANLYSRLATRILVQVAFAEISHEDDILELARNTPWERWFGAEQTLRVDTSAIKSPVQSLQYCNLRAKDGICDRLRELEGERPSIDTVRPDARVHLFLTGHTATLYLDTSGESLFKRGWRLDKGDAPLRENLAAGMLALAGWDPAAALLDPFCGSGTILIEAAWIALGVPPGISRPFGFERLRDHDMRRWHDLKDDARSRILPALEAPLVGYDIDPAAIEFAHNNADRAGLGPDSIRFEVGDARHIEAPASSGWIVTNPPYGERLETAADADLWREWSACLKRNFAGWKLDVISSDMTLPQQMRLKPLRRTPLFNGALDCRLFGFELVAAGYRDA